MAYKVVSGDNLTKIANANGTTVTELMRLNPDIKNADLIFIGQTIQLPSDEGTTAAVPEPVDTVATSTHTVVKGDTLGAIAKANGMTLAEIAALNPDITNLNLILIGQEIILSSETIAPGDKPAADPVPDPEPEPVAPEEGVSDADPETLPGVLAGGTTVRVGGQDGRYYQVYEFPAGSGNFVSYQYNDFATAQSALGQTFAFETHTETWFNNNVLAQGNAETIIGQGGNFATFTQEIMTDAAAAAGIRDPSLAGQIASDPEMQAIMGQAIIGDWTQAQIIAEQRKTNFWKNVLYPGIENLYSKTSAPELAYNNYVRSVEESLITLGYTRDADGTYNTRIKEMLDLNVDANVFVANVPIFISAVENVEFAATLNQWAERDLGRSVDFNDWFDLVAGESAPDLAAVAERAQLAYASQAAGAGLTDLAVAGLSDVTDLSQDQMTQLFTNMQSSLLALGDSGLTRGNLTQDDILKAFAGVSPESGRTIEEVKRDIVKLSRENDLFDEEKLNFFVGFTASGTPTRPGLQAIAPEGA